MTAVEVVFLIFVLLFAIVGVVRGFLRELGVTIVMIVTLFALDRLIPLVEQLIRSGSLQALGWQPYVGDAPTDPATQTALTVIFGLLTLAATFVAYQGETLAFEGKSPAFPVGLILGALVGAVNGYLVVGTLWWLLDHFQYPLNIVQLPLSTVGQEIVDNRLLPLDLLASGTQNQEMGLLPVILIVLILLRVVR